MKKLSKVLVLVLSAIMVLAMSASVFAAPTEKPGTGTITINPPANANGTIEYKIYKVFDATVNGDAVAYKLLPGCTDTDVPLGFTAVRGYITKAPASLEDTTTAFANYDKKVLVDTVTTTGTTAGVSKSLDPGYYYVETTSGAAVMVQAGGTTTIGDKNVLSEVKKSAGTQYSDSAKKAIAAVGTNQPFTVQITKKHGATKLTYQDTLTNMTYNGDVTVKVNGTDVAASNYTVTGAAGDSTFTVAFKDEYVKGLTDNTVITLNYTAKITSEALSTNPAKNEAELTTDSGNTFTDEVEVYNAKITVNKVDDKDTPLPGAKFKLKNAAGKYYAGATSDGDANWTDAGVEVEAVSKDGAYVAEFLGLGAGTYTLEESTVPAGYNKAADQTITVSDSDYTTTNLEKTAKVVNESGAVLPATGGIGTTIFYVLGSLLVVGCGIVLISRKRMQDK